ncbi:MAG: hypothetical protein JWP58_1688 [Hymenobacter sp.]|nr:hypothetical protein [Hymenobacter sp.]
MQKFILLAFSTAFTLGTSFHATAQTKPAAKPAAAAPAAELVDLNLSSLNIPLTLRVPKGTVAKENKHGVPAVQGPGVDLYFEAPAPKAEALANMKRLQGYSTSMGEYENVPTGNPLTMKAKSLYGKPMSFTVAVEDKATHLFYLIQGRTQSLDGEKITVASTKDSYAAALSARYTGK